MTTPADPSTVRPLVARACSAEAPLRVAVLASGGGSNLPGSWTESPVGASEESFGSSGRFLSDGAWDAWSFGEFGSNAPSGPVLAAVACSLCGGGAAGVGSLPCVFLR